MKPKRGAAAFKEQGSARLLLLLIARRIDRKEPSPSVLELCREMNLCDTSNVRKHLSSLVSLGNSR
jgi:hypothetical protein